MQLFLNMVFEQTLEQIVDENYVYARALHYLGVSFFEDQEKSLREVCHEKKLDESVVIKSFYDFDSVNRLPFQELESYPIDLLTKYLRHGHYHFIKERLPFITYVARNCEAPEFQKLLPEFVEDFIKHIYEEEDSVFKYVEVLQHITKGGYANPFAKLNSFSAFSLKAEFEEHQGEDEMKAIRTLVDSIIPVSLKERVLVNEVKSLHRELLYHAEIENKIFFPKALDLESVVADKLKKITSLN